MKGAPGAPMGAQGIDGQVGGHHCWLQKYNSFYKSSGFRGRSQMCCAPPGHGHHPLRCASHSFRMEAPTTHEHKVTYVFWGEISLPSDLMGGERSAMAILFVEFVTSAAGAVVFKVPPDQHMHCHHHLLGFTIYFLRNK